MLSKHITIHNFIFIFIFICNIEIVRYGGCEINTIASIVGAVAAQEVVKVLTHQFIPLDNTWIYNGIISASASYKI